MGSPYLNSGETIVLTTTRVIADTVQYDVMLTNERIFFIDNANVRFEPRIVPLSAIKSIQGGKTPADDPVISLLFLPGIGGNARSPLTMIFSQNTGENRKNERDEWVRNLIQLSISQHEREREPDTPVVREATGLRPAIRHGPAPERVRPLSNVVDRQKVSATVSIIPDESGDAVEITPRAAPVIPVTEESPAPAQEERVPETPPVRGTAPALPVPPARVVIPQITEELLPTTLAPSQGGQEPAPAAVIDQDALFRTIPTAARFMTVTEERTPGRSRDMEIIADPCAPGAGTAPAEPASAGDPEIVVPEDIPEIIRALHTGAKESDTKETSGAVIPDADPASAHESTDIPDSTVPDNTPVSACESTDTLDSTVSDNPPISVYESSDTPDSTVSDNATVSVYESTDIGDTGVPGESPVSAHESTETVIYTVPDAPVIPETIAKEPDTRPAGDATIPQEPVPAGFPPIRHPVPPAREIRPFRTTIVYIAVVLLAVALVAAAAVLLVPQGPALPDTTVTPAPSVVVVSTHTQETVQPTTPLPDIPRTTIPVPLPASSPVPENGVWIRVTSAAEYSGTLGNTGMMRQVSGTGDNFYPVFWSDHNVQVSLKKNDTTGAVLTATIYRNGTVIGTRSVNSPMGTLDLLIDPRTARAPGLSASDIHAGETEATARLEKD